MVITEVYALIWKFTYYCILYNIELINLGGIAVEKNLREITDKDLIVFLVALGMDIKNVEKDAYRNRSLVYFDNNDKLKDAIIKYTNRSISVNISDYLAAEKRVTTLLHAHKQ